MAMTAAAVARRRKEDGLSGLGSRVRDPTSEKSCVEVTLGLEVYGLFSSWFHHVGWL